MINQLATKKSWALPCISGVAQMSQVFGPPAALRLHSGSFWLQNRSTSALTVFFKESFAWINELPHLETFTQRRGTCAYPSRKVQSSNSRSRQDPKGRRGSGSLCSSAKVKSIPHCYTSCSATLVRTANVNGMLIADNLPPLYFNWDIIAVPVTGQGTSF